MLDAHLSFDDSTKFPIHVLDSETFSLEMMVGSEDGSVNDDIREEEEEEEDNDREIIILGGGSTGGEKRQHRSHSSGSRYLVEAVLEHHHPQSPSSSPTPSNRPEEVPHISPKLVLSPSLSGLSKIKFFSRSFVFLKFMNPLSSARCSVVTSKPNGGQSRHALAIGKAQFSIDGSVFEELKISRQNHSSAHFTFSDHDKK